MNSDELMVAHANERYQRWTELVMAAKELRNDEIPIVVEYIKKFISSRPK